MTIEKETLEEDKDCGIILITDDVIILITDDVAVWLLYHQYYAKACGKLCPLLEMLTTVKYMNIVHYYSDRACPTTNICTKLYSYDICKIVHAVLFS